MIIGTWNETEIRFVENNLQLTNRELASRLNMNERTLKRFLQKNQIRRTEEQLQQIYFRRGESQRGENNPNWRGGISNNNYHYKKLQIERFPERVKARKQVHNAKKSGRLIPGHCEICGTDDNIQAHHPDYLKPLEVMWLCPEHHRMIENEGSLFSGEIKSNTCN